MTDPKLLADSLVEAGILTNAVSGSYRLPRELVAPAVAIVEDWRVAGKVLELIDSGSIVNCDDAQLGMWSVMLNGKQAMGDSLPRAIIEAWYEARQ